MEEGLHESLEVYPTNYLYVSSTSSYDVTKFLYVGNTSWYIDSSYALSGDDSSRDPSYIVKFLSYYTSGDDLSKASSSNDEDYFDVFVFFSSYLSMWINSLIFMMISFLFGSLSEIHR